MVDHSDHSFTVRQTRVEIRYANITELHTDAYVISNDVRLSSVSGLSRLIRKAAGPELYEELRKFPVPMPLGSVTVTGSGALRSKYILHAVIVDFQQQPHFDVLVPLLVRRVLALCTSLNIESLAIPMINDGLIKKEPKVVLQVLTQSIACYLAEHASSLQQITLSVYDEDITDHDTHTNVERRMHKDLKDLYATIQQWSGGSTVHNRRIALLQPVCDELTLDQQVRAAVQPSLEEAKRGLYALFQCSNSEAPQLADASVRVFGETPAEYEKARKNLQSLCADLEEQIAQENKTLRQLRTNRNKLEQQAASFGLNVPLELSNGLDDANARFSHKQREITGLEAQLVGGRHELEALNNAWKARQDAGDDAEAPGEQADDATVEKG